jgi:hypothetical protein
MRCWRASEPSHGAPRYRTRNSSPLPRLAFRSLRVKKMKSPKTGCGSAAARRTNDCFADCRGARARAVFYRWPRQLGWGRGEGKGGWMVGLGSTSRTAARTGRRLGCARGLSTGSVRPSTSPGPPPPLSRDKDAGHQHDGSPCFVAERVQIRASFSKGRASALGRLRSSRPNATA